jgi:hypothetical protein
MARIVIKPTQLNGLLLAALLLLLGGGGGGGGAAAQQITPFLGRNRRAQCCLSRLC